MSTEGLFISFEGVEGSGKSTLLASLARRLQEIGREVVCTREPGGTGAGERIRELVLDTRHEGLSAYSELFLMLAARSQIVTELIRPALDRGQVILCDRYGDASTAYQGAGRELGIERVESLNEMATQGLQPALTYLVDLDPAEGRRRIGGREQDRMEREALEFHLRVREGYLELARRHPARFVTLDGSSSPEELVEGAWSALQDRPELRING